MPTEEYFLVCALADAPRTVPGAIFDKRCARCVRLVQIAPSGQRLLRDSALRGRAYSIICGDCWQRECRPSDRTTLAPGALEERAVPNMFRRRN